MALDIPFYTAEAQGPYDLVSIGRFELEEGGVIPDLQLAVATFGTLAEDKSNAILIPTWFSGTHATWAQAYIGPGVGAGAIAAVLGVIGSIFLAIVGVLYYPIKRLLKGRKSKTAKSSGGSKPTT